MNEAQALREQLHGLNSHLGYLQALEGLSPHLAGRSLPGSPHTVFQILHHMVYWQDITLARLRGEKPATPQASELGWQTPGAPEDASDWEATIAELCEGLRAFEELLVRPDLDLGARVAERNTSAREELLMIQGHNSYHLGQIVALRQMLGAWPPPRGGSAW